jgi:O-antigen ligase
MARAVGRVIGPADVLGPPAPGWTVPVRAAAPARDSDLKWDPLLICVAGYMLTAVGRVHQLFPALGVLRPAILTGVVAIVIYLCDLRETRRSVHVLVPTTRYLIVFVGWMMLSMSGSFWPGNSFDLLFDNFLKTVLMYLVIAASVRGVRDVERLAIVYLVSATVYAAVVLLRFDLGSGDAWRLGHLYYYDANDFATFAVSAMPFAVYVIHHGGRTFGRALAGIALAVLSLAFVHTGSRGGFVALLAIGCFIVVRYSDIALRWRIAATALIAVVLLATASDQYWRQMGTIVSDADYNRTDETGRLQIWRRGIGYMMQYPVFGVGPGNFPSAEGRLSAHAERQQFGIGVRWSAAHNSLVQVAAELGVPGLILFVAIIASAFAALRRTARQRHASRRRRRREAQVSQALTASLIGFLVGAFFLSLAYSEMLYTLVALAVGLQKVAGGPAVRALDEHERFER